MKKPLVVLFAILSAMMLLAIACSSDEADPNATATAAPPNTVPADDRATEPPTAPPTSTSPPAAVTQTPSGGPVRLDIDVNGDTLNFIIDTMSAPAGEEVVVTFNNSSTIFSHNWVLVESGTKDDVAAAGSSFPNDNWLEPNDPRVFGSTVLLTPGGSGQATFIAPPAGTYQFVCTFPGHSITMFGDFIVE